ncbi:transposable element Tc1 transposase [Trichonephila clavipes]|nr:transposable element Tc1 transposase [Trichonephila clavipes]
MRFKGHLCTDSLSSLDSLKCISSSNNIIVEIQKQLKSLSDKTILIDFAFVRGHTGVLGNERADWLAKAATKHKIRIDVNIPKSIYKIITKERMVRSWNQDLISNKWYLNGSGCNHADWECIVVIDEFHFHLCPDNHRRRVWRRSGQLADPAFTFARHTGPQQDAMVWEDISFEAGLLWSSLDTLTAHRLSNSSLVSQIARFICNRACLGYDGKTTAYTRNVDDLSRQLEQIWQETLQKTISVLYHPMSRHVAACI